MLPDKLFSFVQIRKHTVINKNKNGITKHIGYRVDYVLAANRHFKKWSGKE